MERLIKWSLGILGVVVVVCMVLLIPSASDRVAKWTGSTGDKIRGAAETIAGIAIGLILVTFAIAAVGAMPIVAGVLFAAGLAVLLWNVYPLFKKTKPMTENAKG